MIVSKISLLSTRAFAPDGRHFILNNANISDGTIINYTRTTGYAVSYTIEVAADTPMEKITKLKATITKWIHRRRNVWSEDFMFEVSNIDKLNTVAIDFWCMLIGINWYGSASHPKLCISVIHLPDRSILDYVIHRGTVGAYYAAKNEFFLFLKGKIDKLGITYVGPPIFVNIHSGKAAARIEGM
jgi:hypothetical protein